MTERHVSVMAIAAVTGQRVPYTSNPVLACNPVGGEVGKLVDCMVSAEVSLVLEGVPGSWVPITCPRCAVLWDDAMHGRTTR